MTNDYVVRSVERDDGTVIELGGDLDLAVVPDLRQALDPAVRRGRTFSVDLAEVTYLDSSALHALLEALRAQRDAGLDIVFLRPTPAVARVLEMIGMGIVTHAEPHPHPPPSAP